MTPKLLHSDNLTGETLKIRAVTYALVAALVGNAMAVPFTDGTGNSAEQGISTEVYLQEIRKQLDDSPVRAANSRNSRNIDSATITHGSTIALQSLYDKRNWLGCTGQKCGKETCPNLYMEGDGYNCSCQVFQIYHICGPGEITVGDAIGIYYPKEQKWFGCATGILKNCKKGICPGQPATQYGFENLEKWFSCSGEVFVIYARGKSLGEPITAHDNVMLYYISGEDYVRLGSQQAPADRSSCPGTVRPPPRERYDVCYGENFEIYMYMEAVPNDSQFVPTEY